MSADHVFERNPLFVDTSDPSKLSERVYLSGAYTARQHDVLRALGITAIVNLTPDDFGAAEAGFKVLRLAIDDAVALDPRYVARFLAQMVEWEASGDVVLIHCHAGISRTSSFAIAWLMHQRGANAESDLHAMWSECEDAVLAIRPIIMPHYLLKRAVLNHFANQPAATLPVMDVAHCVGCRNDFYNDKNPLGVKRCWSLDTATLVRRKRVHRDQRPPWSQPAIVVPDCYHETDFVFVAPEVTS